MYFDAITLRAVRDELCATILGGRIQHVHLPDEHSLALQVYAQGQRRWLYCTAESQRPRAYLVDDRPARTTDHVSPLLLLLRKYADGARVDFIEQPDYERALRLGLSTRLPDNTLARTELVLELIGRQANVVLLDEDGSVLDALRRVPPDERGRRTILPHWRYIPPTAPNRIAPVAVTGRDLAAAAASLAGKTAVDVLTATVAGCSPLLAREALSRGASAGADVPASAVTEWDAVAVAVRELWADALAGRAAPTVAHDGDRLVAFAPYLLRCLPGVEPAPGISAALEAFYGQAPATGEQDAARKRALRQALEAARDKLRAKRFSLQRSLPDADEVERLRQAGEALLAFGAQVPAGATAYTPPAWETPIELDPEQDAVSNARRYFARYAKVRDAAREVPEMLASTERDLAYLDEAELLLELARTAGELNALQAEWAELGFAAPLRGGARRAGQPGYGRPGRSPGKSPGKSQGKLSGRSPGKPGRSEPFARVDVDDFQVLIGRSGRGNDALLGQESHPEDIWLHARGVPGAHVLLRSRGRPVPERVLRRAAALAAAHSRSREAGTVAVDYTARKHVQRIRGAPPGLVTYRGERTIHVAPEA